MIADVLLKNQQYITVDERGKEIAREFESRLGTLMDFSDTFLIFKRNNQYYSYDENFKELAREFDSRLGICRKVVGAVTTFKKDNQIHYCPRNSFNIKKSNKLTVTHQN